MERVYPAVPGSNGLSMLLLTTTANSPGQRRGPDSCTMRGRVTAPSVGAGRATQVPATSRSHHAYRAS